MIKTAMVVAVLTVAATSVPADECIPVDAVVACSSKVTDRYQECFSRSGGVSQNTHLVVLATPADPNEFYVMGFGGFDVNDCDISSGAEACNTVTGSGNLRIEELSNVEGTIRRVSAARLDDSVSDFNPACELGLTVTF